MFQSSPNPKVGCYLKFPNAYKLNSLAVSILTQPEGWVLHICPNPPGIVVLFQSSPNPKVGCYVRLQARPHDARCFNPHPTRRLGATLRVGAAVEHVRFVSILTQPEGWVLR